MAKWVIRGTTENETDPLTGERLYWSNEIGWVDKHSADIYDDCKGNLPIGGEWEKIRKGDNNEGSKMERQSQGISERPKV